ncbi:glutamate receptor 2.4-like [Nymphaea colorata]|nr:glutamate receptor 2.4-like [Nymphaea colorata]
MQAVTFHLSFFLTALFWRHVCGFQAVNQSATRVNVGLMLDLSTPNGKISSTCIDMALEDFYSNHNHSKILVLHQETNYRRGVVEAASAAIELLRKVEVEATLGPVTSGDAEFVADLGDMAHVPVISFTATSPSLSPKHRYFIRTAQNDLYQVGAIADIVKAYGWGEVVPIYEDSEFGKGVIPNLTDALQMVDVRVPARAVLSNNSVDEHIRGELERLMLMQTRVFVVHMPPDLGGRLFTCARELGMLSEGYVWIVTNGMGNLLDELSHRPEVLASMEGALVLKTYVPETPKLKNFTVKWRSKFQSRYPKDDIPPHPDVFGLWAYDTISALASALERSYSGNTRYHHHHHGRRNSSASGEPFANMGVSPSGSSISIELGRSRFRGLSGDFVLEKRQLVSQVMEITNLVGKGEKHVGFWTSKTGLVKKISKECLESGSKGKCSANVGLRTVVWPGDRPAVPKGWVIPANGTRLRIAVPVKSGFQALLKVETDTGNQEIAVEGYCIEVFKKVLEIMPYYLHHDFIPFPIDGKPNSTYDDLVKGVYLQNYDAVVGDTTITAERAKLVDFTMPYADTGVTMIVANKAERKMSALIFLRPLTKELWLTTGAFFVLTGFVIWILEHRINPDFRGPPSAQMGIIFYFAFSTMVFAHRERLASNLSRVVVIVWVFVVLILTQSYMASLTSMLTVQQLQPTVTDIDTLLRDGESIGCQNGSFVRNMLINQLKVPESQLKLYTSPAEYADALVNGSQKGGVGAIFDEIPYIRLFLAKYCRGFAMAGPIYKAGGFGFVFPRGSPFVAAVSRAILNVTEADRLLEIEERLYENQTCIDVAIEVGTNNLSLTRLRGLFFLTGTATTGVLFLLFLTSFCFSSGTPRSPFAGPITERMICWQSAASIFKRFGEKDTPSRAFGNTSASDNFENYDAVVGDTTVGASRSQYVDFTLPYTETGVSMVVRAKAGRKPNPFRFLKPMTAQPI